jgi:hypothetical protein
VHGSKSGSIKDVRITCKYYRSFLTWPGWSRIASGKQTILNTMEWLVLLDLVVVA